MTATLPGVLTIEQVIAVAHHRGVPVIVDAASAEAPFNSEKPSITGPNPPTVGSTLTGNNGSWLYTNGNSCGGDCSYTFEFSRCTANTAESCTVVRGDSADAVSLQ